MPMYLSNFSLFCCNVKSHEVLSVLSHLGNYAV